ncbi:calcium/sodium antiporter [uncultured Litoreibacter sp.]|uniref:calcium/sodium antiporter n=1 Tax=uncultured Litoreibacter sp. TaxID=1392394 RepID=UPI00261CAE1A|nr:calcium/sodium antiporter [uncultured Litoreibacter sp.]
MNWLINEFTLAAVGLTLLLFAGDALVKGAVNLSLRLGVPALIVSLTIVAFGTSAPELLISVQSILDGEPGLAIGNVVGSNTANVLLVLGIPALLAGLSASQSDTRKSYVIMILGTLLFIGLAFYGPITWWHGLVLLAALALMLLDSFRDARLHMRSGVPEEEPEGADLTMRGWKITAFLIAGIIGLPLGAKLLVDNAVIIATDFGVSPTVIGLTLVAIGTSMPELATTVMAAFRKKADVAIGNVIGSNVFNLLAIIGIASLVGPMPVPDAFLKLDLWVMLGASLLIAPVVFRRQRMGYGWGFGLTLAYLAYLYMVLTNGA